MASDGDHQSQATTSGTSTTIQQPGNGSGVGCGETDKPNDSIDDLRKEIERLKSRLEEERKKLNDVSCKLNICSYPIKIIYVYQNNESTQMNIIYNTKLTVR